MAAVSRRHRQRLVLPGQRVRPERRPDDPARHERLGKVPGAGDAAAVPAGRGPAPDGRHRRGPGQPGRADAHRRAGPVKPHRLPVAGASPARGVPHGRRAGSAQPVREQHEGLVLHDPAAGRRWPASDVRTREPLSRDALTELIGAERITESAHTHRDHIRSLVFGLHGDAGRDRFDGLLQLLHTLRAPDVGNRIDEGRLPQILLESLPPLQEEALDRAGEQLDGLTETRLAQQRLEDSAREVDKFLGVYRRYAAETLRARAQETLAAATAVTEARTAGRPARR